MKKYFLLLTINLLAISIFAKTLEVCNSCEWTTITAAIKAAEKGDQLIIKAGIYKEGKIIVNKSLTISGEDYPILDGENKGEILTVLADNVTIEGLQIQNVGTSYMEDRAGIRIKRAKNFTIKNNRLYNTFFGIYLEHADKGIVQNNELIGEAVEEMSSGNAIHLWYCKNILIEKNIVRHHRDGIYLEFVDNSKVRFNISEDNLRYGLHFMFSNNDDYFKNEFRRNGAGVAVMFSKKINMWENAFEYNWGKASYGLLLKEIYDADIKNNCNYSANLIAD